VGYVREADSLAPGVENQRWIVIICTMVLVWTAYGTVFGLVTLTLDCAFVVKLCRIPSV